MIIISDIRKILILILITALVAGSGLNAQTVKSAEQKSYKAEDGTLYWNKKMPVYIRLANSPTDTGQLVKYQSKDDIKPYFFDNEGINYIRTQWATDSLGRKLSPPVEVKWEVYADGEAPKSLADFSSGTEFLDDNIRYYGRDLAIEIMAIDKLSGVEKTYYSINGLPYAEFTSALEINREGDYSLKYYSTDKVGNVETEKQINFRLDMTAPVSEYQIAGGTFNDIFSVNTRIILTASDFGAGVKDIFYRFDNDEIKTYKGTHISIANLDNGEHTVYYFAKDNVNNVETEKSFDFYLDKMAPILTSTIIGDQFVKDGKIYFSGRSKLKLTGADDKSGLQEIQYSMNGAAFSVYTEPFYLPNVSGLHTVKYFALDSMQNKTETKRLIDAHFQNMIMREDQLYADIVAPTLSYDFIGKSFKTRDTLFLSGNTKIRFKGRDSESGVNRVMYYLDGKSTPETYSLPFSLEHVKSGAHTLRIVCYDNVNNQTEKEFSFVLDNTPPELHHFFSVAPYAKQDGFDVYPTYVNLYLAASDAVTGAKSVMYSVNGAPKRKYIGTISGFIPGKLNTVTIYTTDNLGNKNTEEIQFYVK